MLLVLLILGSISCKPEIQDLSYAGKDIVYLSTLEEPTLDYSSDKTIPIQVQTTYRVSQDTPLEISLEGLNGADLAWIKVTEPSIVIPKGERSTVFHIGVNNQGTPPTQEDSEYNVTIKNLDARHQSIDKDLRIRLQYTQTISLTEDQKELLKKYKEMGLDLSPFIGKVKVKTHVQVPADGLIEGFKYPWEKDYEGYTILTLSPDATETKPILYMDRNPMGLDEFLYYGLRKNTIENYEFWYAEGAGPRFKQIMEAIQWNDKSVETFSAYLDGLKIKTKPDKDGNFVFDNYTTTVETQLDEFKAVPFRYRYSAWDRQKQWMDSGDEEAMNCYLEGGTAEPQTYLNVADVRHSVTVDPRTDKYKKLPKCTGKIDVKQNKMTFFFWIYIENSGDHTAVTVEYQGNPSTAHTTEATH